MHFPLRGMTCICFASMLPGLVAGINPYSLTLLNFLQATLNVQL